MKHKTFFKLSLILTLLWMLVIFFFSARPASVSSEDSSRLSRWIGMVLYDDFEDWSPEEQQAFTDRIDHPVRKASHATEYAILGILVLSSVMAFCSQLKYSLLPSWLIATLYAASDEFHQLFVPGRAGQITDVMIDSIGVLLGLFLFSAIYLLSHRNRRLS